MIPRSLMAGTSLVLALAAAAPAFALEKTSPSRHDQNIRFVVYDPDNVVPLKTTMGTALMVTFAPDEHIVKVAVSDSARLMTDVVKDSNQHLANYLFLKPIALKEDPPGYVLPAQPLMVITERKGTLRHYQFLFQAQPAGGDPDYAVVFRYPHDAYMQRLAEARERQHRDRLVLARCHGREQGRRGNRSAVVLRAQPGKLQLDRRAAELRGCRRDVGAECAQCLPALVPAVQSRQPAAQDRPARAGEHPV